VLALHKIDCPLDMLTGPLHQGIVCNRPEATCFTTVQGAEEAKILTSTPQQLVPADAYCWSASCLMHGSCCWLHKNTSTQGLRPVLMLSLTCDQSPTGSQHSELPPSTAVL
jgi:hypothetical protein